MPTIESTIRCWIEHRAKMRDLLLVAQSTWHNQSKIAHVLIDGLPASTAIGDLRKSHVELYVGARLQTCAPITVRAEVNVLRQILNWCEDEMLLTVKPRLPTVRVPNVETSLPADAAFEFVLLHLRPPHSLALEFMMLTGLSPHEMERLQAGDHRRSIPPSIGIGQRNDFPVKTPARRRIIPLSQRAYDVWHLATAGANLSDPAFPSTEAVTKAIQRLKRAHPDAPAGVDQITPKAARKWFASRVAGQHPEHVLQRLLGHSPGSTITRRHYTRSTDQQTANAVEGICL